MGRLAQGLFLLVATRKSVAQAIDNVTIVKFWARTLIKAGLFESRNVPD